MIVEIAPGADLHADGRSQMMADITHRHPPAYKLIIIESKPSRRPCPVRTRRGVKEPARSRGTSISKAPTSDITGFFVVPLLVFERACPLVWPFSYPKCSESSAAKPLQRLLKQHGQQPLTARHLDLASIKTLKQRIQRPRATQLLHSLTPTSARHNNNIIIIIHHASILSNKKTDTQTIEHALDRRKIGHNHTPLPHTNTRIHPPFTHCS